MIVGDLTITSLDSIAVYGLTGDFLFEVDELQNANINNTEEKVDITGKGGRKLNSLKRNKAVTITGTNGLLSNGLLEVQTGSKFAASDTAVIKWADYLTVGENNTAKTVYKAIGTAGAEVHKLAVRAANGTQASILTQGDNVAAGVFKYDPATGILSFNETDCPKGTEIVVHYFRQVSGSVLENKSDVFSGKGTLYITATAEDTCNKQYLVQIYVPKADFNGNFDIALGDNQTVHAFEATSLAGSCGSAGNLWTYTVVGADYAGDKVKVSE